MSGTSLRGYVKVPGSARQWRTPSGKIISRREYDNRRLKRQGWKNRYEAEKFRESGKYLKWRTHLRDSGKSSKELDIFSDWAKTLNEIDPDRAEREVREIRSEYGKGKTARTRARNDPRLRDPNGPLAELLEALGLRDPDWEWSVGDTP